MFLLLNWLSFFNKFWSFLCETLCACKYLCMCILGFFGGGEDHLKFTKTQKITLYLRANWFSLSCNRKESVQAVTNRRNETKESVEDLASRAVSHFSSKNTKNIVVPKSAYEFEVSWKALADDRHMQAHLLKVEFCLLCVFLCINKWVNEVFYFSELR